MRESWICDGVKGIEMWGVWGSTGGNEMAKMGSGS